MMHRLEALQILKAKLAAIDEEYNSEFAENEDARERSDAKAEARALAAVLDFCRTTKLLTPIHCFAFLDAICARDRGGSRRMDTNNSTEGGVSIVASVWR
jgi:hypothetical protein